MAKFDNPVRGFIRCPVCSSAASAHQVGEGQLIATGEPPKNSRNLGLMYYRCPECGNSSISKKVTEFIQANKVEQVTELPALPANLDKDSTPSASTGNQPSEPIEVSSVTPDNAQASADAVGSVEATEHTGSLFSLNTPSWLTLKRVLIGLAAVACTVWVVRQLMPKPHHKEETHVTT